MVCEHCGPFEWDSFVRVVVVEVVGLGPRRESEWQCGGSRPRSARVLYRINDLYCPLLADIAGRSGGIGYAGGGGWHGGCSGAEVGKGECLAIYGKQECGRVRGLCRGRVFDELGLGGVVPVYGVHGDGCVDEFGIGKDCTRGLGVGSSRVGAGGR